MLVTVSTAIAFGVFLIVLARRTGLPAIVLLLAGGVLLGPEVLGQHALVRTEGLGNGLTVLVSLAVGLILFEGGLTLDREGFRAAPAMIPRLLTIGVAITWGGSAAALIFLLGVAPRYALLAASLVIVTGPTVIAPLLKRVRVQPRLHAILHWEGVLIDPIGVFCAVLCFEIVVGGVGGEAALLNLGLRIIGGLAIGAAGGLFLTWTVRRRVVPEDMINVFAFACAVFVFGAAEMVREEAGLLAVTVAGFVFGLLGPRSVRRIRAFKAEITDLLIGMLFVLLASRLEFAQFSAFGVRGALAVAAVMLLVRPASILACSIGLDLTLRERLFLSWVAPRGIVAASVSSLFAIAMIREGAPEADARFVETFVWSVIIATIVIQGFTAGPFARILGLRRPEPTGWLVVGAHRFARRITRFLVDDAGVTAIIADSNARAIREVRNEGIEAILGDATEESVIEQAELRGVGNLLALTDNDDLNIRLCDAWRETVGAGRVFRCNPTGSDPTEVDEDHGRLVWLRLPRPSIMAAEIARGEASIRAVRGPAPRWHRSATPLAVVQGDRVSFDPPAEPIEDESAITLYLRRRAEYLGRAVRPELVARLDGTSREEIIAALLDRIIAVAPNLPRQDIYEELLERERTFPTVLGHGVASPHAYVAGLDHRICAIGQVPEGVPYAAGEHGRVALVFLLLSPQGDPEGHLATLAEIARLMLDETTRQAIAEGANPLEIVQMIRRTLR